MKKIIFRLIELLPFFTVLAVLVYIGYWQMAQFKKTEHLQEQILDYQKQLKPIISGQKNNNSVFEQQTVDKNRLGFGQNYNKIGGVIAPSTPETKTRKSDDNVLEESPASLEQETNRNNTTEPSQEESQKEMTVDYDTKEKEVFQLDTAEMTTKENDQKNMLAQQLEKCQQHLAAHRLTTGGGKGRGNAFDCFSEILENNPENEQAKAGVLTIETRYERYIKENIAANNIPKAERFLSTLNRINPKNNAINDLKKKLDEVKFLTESLAMTDSSKTVTDTAQDTAEIADNVIEEKSPNKADAMTSKKQSSSGSFIEITAGCFNKQSTAGSSKVCIKNNYLISKYEVTQKQWTDIMGTNPAHFKSCGLNCPVENISWFEVQEFIRKLNKQTGLVYRLPSENEWEYAARAGSDTKFSFGNEPEKLAQYGNYCDKKCTNDWRDAEHSDGAITTAPVGNYLSNKWGLFDIHGNVWEWVEDMDADKRVYRGGSWGDNYNLCQSSSRGSTKPDFHVSGIGFRLVQN